MCPLARYSSLDSLSALDRLDNMNEGRTFSDDEVSISAFDHSSRALVDYWKEQGIEFDALKTRVEIENFYIYAGESSWVMMRRLGMKYREILNSSFPHDLRKAIDEKLGNTTIPRNFVGSHLLGFSVCDMYRIVDAIRNLPDDDAGVLAYLAHIPVERNGNTQSDYEDVEKYMGRFLPENYFAMGRRHGSEIVSYVDIPKVEARRDEIAKELADLIDENIKFELEPGASIRVIRRENSGETLDKRTYSGDIPGANVLVLSECAISDFNITIPAEKVDDENAAVAVITNNLTGRSLQMKGISDGKKRLIKSGHNFTLHGHDMKTEWVLAIIEEKDDA